VIQGIGEVYEVKLKESGINSVEMLLEACSLKKGRNELAKKLGVTEKLILKWANHADLIRIKGIGGDYADLLEASGVDTVPELAKRKPDNLLAKMLEVNEAKKIVKKMPTQKQVEDWVRQAGELPRALKY
jgi:predicted flap endonuclease-1-like 5' DNA nuclease